MQFVFVYVIDTHVNIYEYSCKWGLKVNVKKTKVCIFEKRKTNNAQQWNINNENLDVVDNFCYLGAKFYYNGNMNHAAKSLSEQALRAMNNLLSLFTRIPLDVKTKLSLFDTMVVPIILYSSEIWGVYDFKEVDKIHIKFCKTILGVKSQTPNMAVLGELGRYPLSLICKERALKFWIKVKRNPESLINKVYLDQCQIEGLPNNRTNILWANKIKSILNNLGYSYIFDNFDSNIDYLPSLNNV